MSKLPVTVTGHCLITDDIGNVHLNQTNSIHYVNMSRIIGRALAHEPNCGLYKIAFGTGGTTYTSETTLRYEDVRDTNWNDKLYHQVYSKLLEVGTEFDVMSNDNTTSGCGIVSVDRDRISQVVITGKLGKDEPFGQNQTDVANANNENFIFDEIGLFTYGADTGHENTPDNSELEQERMLTHLIFSPVMKSANRTFNIKYTLTIYVNKTSIAPEVQVINPPDQTLPTVVQIKPSSNKNPMVDGTVGEDRLTTETFIVYVDGIPYTPTYGIHNDWHLQLNGLSDGVHQIYAVRTNYLNQVFKSAVMSFLITGAIIFTITPIVVYSNVITPRLPGTLNYELSTGDVFKITINGVEYTPTVNGLSWFVDLQTPIVGVYDATITYNNTPIVFTGSVTVLEAPMVYTPTVNVPNNVTTNQLNTYSGTLGGFAVIPTEQEFTLVINGISIPYATITFGNNSWSVSDITISDVGSFNIDVTLKGISDTTSGEITVSAPTPTPTPSRPAYLYIQAVNTRTVNARFVKIQGNEAIPVVVGDVLYTPNFIMNNQINDNIKWVYSPANWFDLPDFNNSSLILGTGTSYTVREADIGKEIAVIYQNTDGSYSYSWNTVI